MVNQSFSSPRNCRTTPKEGESLTGALRRELKEEVGVGGRITGIDLLFTKKLPYLPGRPGRDGFKVGKEYFVCKAKTRGGILSFLYGELAGSKWVEKEIVLLGLCAGECIFFTSLPLPNGTVLR